MNAFRAYFGITSAVGRSGVARCVVRPALSPIVEDGRGCAQVARPTILKREMGNPDTATADALSQQGLELLAAGKATEAASVFRAAISADGEHIEAHHGLVRALRDAGRLEESVGAALRLTVLTPQDPLAHTALSISLQHAGHIPEAEAAAARARVMEWKVALQSPPEEQKS